VTNNGYIGNIDDSADPVLPAWYVSGWNAQQISQYSLPAPAQSTVYSQLPTDLTYVPVTGNYDDGSGNWLGGYLTFEQSDDLLYGPDPSTGQYYRIPKRLVGQVPVPNILAFNWEGSGRIYIQFGSLNVMLLATDTPHVVVQQYTYQTQEPGWVQPVSWVYHVKEYFMRGAQYDIAPVMAQATTGVDINSLIVPGTYAPNDEWSPQWCS
jgi:hypothetical protein